MTSVTGLRDRPFERGWSRRQAEICDELEDVFLSEGFCHLRVGDLVSRLHCSRHTLYGLAPSREELVVLVIARFFDRVASTAQASAGACSDAGQAVLAFLESVLGALGLAEPAFTEDLESYPPAQQLYDRHRTAMLGTLGRLVEAGVAQGTFCSYHPRLVAEILDAALRRLGRPEALARAGVSRNEALAELKQLIRNGLVNDGRRT